MKNYLFMWVVGLIIIVNGEKSHAIEWEGQQVIRPLIYSILRTTSLKSTDPFHHQDQYTCHYKPKNCVFRDHTLMKTLNLVSLPKQLMTVCRKSFFKQIAYCDAEDQNRDFIEDALKCCKTHKVKKLELLASDMTVVYLIGSSQNGKTTAYNYLLDYRLMVDHKQNLLSHSIYSTDSLAAKTGDREKSETLEPNVAKHKDEALVFCDLPGFFYKAVKEIKQNNIEYAAADALKAAYFTKRYIASGKKRKFILVLMEEANLRDATVKLVTNMLPKHIGLEDYSLILLTQSFFSKQDINTENLGTKIKEKYGYFVRGWKDDRFMHLIASGLVTNEEYAPQIFDDNKECNVKECIIDKLKRFDSMPIFQSEIEKIDYRELILDELAQKIEEWCAEKLFRKLWKEVATKVFLEQVHKKDFSIDRYLDSCLEAVRLKIDNEINNKSLIATVKYVSQKMIDNALIKSKSEFRSCFNDATFQDNINNIITTYTDKDTPKVTKLWNEFCDNPKVKSFGYYFGEILFSNIGCFAKAAFPALLLGGSVVYGILYYPPSILFFSPFYTIVTACSFGGTVGFISWAALGAYWSHNNLLKIDKQKIEDDISLKISSTFSTNTKFQKTYGGSIDLLRKS